MDMLKVDHQNKISTILSFWFGELSSMGLPSKQIANRWWQADPGFDDQIREEFAEDVLQASYGKYNSWQTTAQGTLALIILLDQFSRNIFRGTQAAYQNDTLALAVASQGVDKSYDQQLKPIERIFFYMPFEHSEILSDQERSVSLMQSLVAELPMSLKKDFEDYVLYAIKHKEVIEKFGRFPHRNEILNRRSTEEEKSHLRKYGGF